jgi:hypothetical protein
MQDCVTLAFRAVDSAGFGMINKPSRRLLQHPTLAALHSTAALSHYVARMLQVSTILISTLAAFTPKKLPGSYTREGDISLQHYARQLQ